MCHGNAADVYLYITQQRHCFTLREDCCNHCSYHYCEGLRERASVKQETAVTWDMAAVVIQLRSIAFLSAGFNSITISPEVH